MIHYYLPFHLDARSIGSGLQLCRSMTRTPSRNSEIRKSPRMRSRTERTFFVYLSTHRTSRKKLTRKSFQMIQVPITSNQKSESSFTTVDGTPHFLYILA